MAKINPIQLQKHLKGVDYPASKQDLMDAADRNGGGDDVRAALEQLPAEQYQTPADVSQALGGIEDEEGGDSAPGGQDRGDREQGASDGRSPGRINPIQLQKHLKGVDYPASRQDLLAAADRNGADHGARAALDALPDRQYHTPAEVNKALGGGNDR